MKLQVKLCIHHSKDSYKEFDLHTSSLGIISKLVRNADSWVTPRLIQSESAFQQDFQRDPYIQEASV